MRELPIYFLIVILALTPKSWGQNLVPNPSFEEYDNCTVHDTFYYTRDRVKLFDKIEGVYIKDWHRFNNSGRVKGRSIASWESKMNYINIHDIKFFCRGEKETFFENIYYEDDFPQPLSGDLMYYLALGYSGSHTQYDRGIVTKLNSPMEKDSVYRLNFFLRSTPYTVFTTDNFSWHLSPQELDYTQWYADTIRDLSAEEYSIYQSMPGTRLEDIEEWTEFSSCYQARGDEKCLYFFLDIAHNMDTFLLTSFMTEYESLSPEERGQYAPDWARNTWHSVGVISEMPTVFIDSISLEKVSYDPITRDTLLFCTEDPLWQLDSTQIKQQEIFNSVNISHFWEDGEQELHRSFPDTGKYVLHVNSQCGAYTYEYYVRARDCREYIYIPTAFTPNDDGVNDILAPVGKNFTPVSFSVNDRNGTRIFEGREDNLGWDGKHKGEDVSPGIYVYKFIYINDAGERKQLTGSVSVIR